MVIIANDMATEYEIFWATALKLPKRLYLLLLEYPAYKMPNIDTSDNAMVLSIPLPFNSPTARP